MPDDDAQRRIRSSVVPTIELINISNKLTEVATGVKSIKEDMLPPLISDTREARDKAREALQRSVEHERDDAAHVHPCVERERQSRQDTDIADLKPRVSGTSKLVWWVLGLGVVALSSAVGFAILTRSTEAGTTVRIEAMDRDLDRHEALLVEFRRSYREDRDALLREVRAIPAKVQQGFDPPERVLIERLLAGENGVPLTPHERRVLRDLAKRAPGEDGEQ